MKIKLDFGAILPTRAHEDDAGLDLRTPRGICVPRTKKPKWKEIGINVGSVTVDTGVHVEIPRGYVGYIKSKSGLNVKYGLTAEGVIDSGYTGSIKVKLYNHTSKDYIFMAGEKIAQLVIHPIITPDLDLVDELTDTERGSGGFGSTGR